MSDLLVSRNGRLDHAGWFQSVALGATRSGLLLAAVFLAGCAGKPLLPYSDTATPLMLVPAVQAPAQDRRGRFQEIFCAVLEARQAELPDYMPCDKLLVNPVDPQAQLAQSVNLGHARHPLRLLFVPGLGWDCFAAWLAETQSIPQHLRRFGYDMQLVEIDGFGDSLVNARNIRDAVLALPPGSARADTVLLGYSKGAVDMLHAIAVFPEIRSRVVAMVSLAGAVGGSPLANDTSNEELELMRLFPGATCEPVGEGALKELKPSVRQAWLAGHPLPDTLAYYSLITLPEPDRISRMLQASHRKLARVDARNDGQVIFYNQFIPGGFLTAYLNADHLAVAVPIARTHPVIAALLAEYNAFPREAMLEALLRLIDEDIASGRIGSGQPAIAP